ncbi:MAG: hypothetical protein A2Y73_01950 [Chloroflexi bacterium RBG_13_56_8]|nr:MAG: hypothetical protein A2Y73_01950 [Chloroflexi bacterium RBG_13_56_8]
MFKIGINIDNEANKPPEKIAPGYEFSELPVGEMLFPFNSDAMWEKQLARLKALPVPPMTCTSHFLDGFGLIATGPDADWEQVEFWTRRAFRRLADVGVQVVGCYGGHFVVPEGFSKTEAKDQALRFINLLAECAEPHGLKIALEPYSDLKTLFPRYLQGVEIAREVNRPEICVMADLNYFIDLNQDLNDIKVAPELLMHVHIAGKGGSQPGVGDLLDWHTNLFRVLRDIGYERGVSAACPWVSSDGGPFDLTKETAKTLRYLKDLREKVYAE